MKVVQRATRVVTITLIGSVLLAAGLVMLVTPGPGLLAMAAGLAVLGREYSWARRLLAAARDRLSRQGRTDDVARTRRWDPAPADAEADLDAEAA